MVNHNIYETLDQLNISYQNIDHPPVFTNDQARMLVPTEKGASAKNLFLRDRKGKRHFLIMLDDNKELDLINLAAQIGSSRLSFASKERLMTHLGIEPGSVSPLALINDTDHAVELWVDPTLIEQDFIQCHPLVNTSTLIISVSDLFRFFDKTGHKTNFISIQS